MALRFIEETHQYFDGDIELPSVTSIVSIYGEDTDENLEDVMDAAAERGTTCHKILEMLLTSNSDIEYPSAYDGYVDAIMLFLSEHTIVPYAIETPIGSVKLYAAGTPDILCEFDGVLTVLDWKFVSQIAKTKVKSQLNGYLEIYGDNGIFPEQLLAVQFLNTGLYRIYPVSIDNTEFYMALQVYQLKNKKHPRGRIE